MRRWLVAITLGLVLAGCGRKDDAAFEGDSGVSRGRYAGIGIYGADRLWAKMMLPPDAVSGGADAARATIADDDTVIVVVDTQTGEVRQCGNHSGLCVSMSPWSRDRRPQALPVRLSAHQVDVNAASSEPAPAGGRSAGQ